MSTPAENNKQVLDNNYELVKEFVQKHFPEESIVISVEDGALGAGIEVMVRIGLLNTEQDAQAYMRNTNRNQSFLLAIATKFAIQFKSILVSVDEYETRFRFKI